MEKRRLRNVILSVVVRNSIEILHYNVLIFEEYMWLKAF